MRKTAVLACVIALTDFGGPAHAGLLRSVPALGDANTAIIANNALLSEILAEDPWLVRRVLDLFEGSGATGSSSGIQSLDHPASGHEPDQIRDRAHGARSAESSVEWFALVKEARKKRDAGSHKALPVDGSSSARSALGSMEMIKMVKEAKEKKGQTGVTVQRAP